MLLSPKETLPLNVPPFAEDTVSLGENADKATTSTTSPEVKSASPEIADPSLAIKSLGAELVPSTSFTPLR